MALVIWALFDDAESCYKNAIESYFPNEKINVYSIGINDVTFPKSEKYFYKRIDLSLNNFNLFNELKKLPKPNIILSSPPVNPDLVLIVMGKWWLPLTMRDIDL